jgi:quinol monooxygenase YgiN
MFIRHKVSDYAKWRQVYDSVAEMQKQGGVTAQSVYQSEEDPNDLTVTHDFASAAEAKTFLERADLQKAMADGGVVGAPTIWIASKA